MRRGLSHLASAVLAVTLIGLGTLNGGHVGVARAAAAATAAYKVAIATPYLTAPATHEMVGLLQKGAAAHHWTTTVVSSDGDIATLASKLEDTINSKVNAIIVVSTDLHLLKKQIDDAKRAHIAVFGVDAVATSNVAASVSSNSDQMSSLVTGYLFKRLNYKGNIVVLTYSPHPGVHERTVQFYRMAKRYPGIHVIAQQEIDVSSMVQSGNKITTDLLTAHPTNGSINAVWCGWDEPAIGATEAIQAAHRSGIIVTGIDGADQAVSLIKKGSPLIATVKQRFDLQTNMIVQQIARYFGGKSMVGVQLYAPATLITRM